MLICTFASVLNREDCTGSPRRLNNCARLSITGSKGWRVKCSASGGNSRRIKVPD